jgi:hypothetical protein
MISEGGYFRTYYHNDPCKVHTVRLVYICAIGASQGGSDGNGRQRFDTVTVSEPGRAPDPRKLH